MRRYIICFGLAGLWLAPTALPALGQEGNPLLVPSSLKFEAPPFDRIRTEHFGPAMEQGMREQLAEIKAIDNDPEPPTFDNTLVALEKSGRLLTRVTKIFYNLSQSNSDAALQKLEADMAPKLAAHQDAIFLDPNLFARVKAVYEQRDDLKLDPESYHLVERYYQMFVHAGAELSAEDREKVKALNAEEASLSTRFGNRLLEDTKDSAVAVSDGAELKGLTEADKAAAAEAAKRRDLKGEWLLALQNTTQQPVLGSLDDRALREKVYDASIHRGQQGNANDVQSTILRLAEIRAEKAKLLGFPNFAAYNLQDQMAHTPQAVDELLHKLSPPAVANARKEASEIQKVIDADQGGFQLKPWDWDLYAEQVRKAHYDLDGSQIKPYFELNRVREDGVFYAAHVLYGLTFKPRLDLPVYNPDVKAYEVFDENGNSLAIWYCDYFARDNKHGGAWEDTFVDQSDLLGSHTVVVNCCNFVKPAEGQPALLSFDEVTTMFHEFGHALHAMLSNVKYPLFSGTSTPRDFVEFPSQFNENWALDPVVFANYAHHYQTGEPMPADLVKKLKNSQKFNQGYATTEYLEAALLDMAWHELPVGGVPKDVDKFEQASLERDGVALEAVPPRYRSTYFSHIWDGGYSAGYYAYIWSEVLADDAYQWFKEHGGLKPENGREFRKMILSRGGTKDVHDLYLKFRGHEPSIEPLLEKRGLSKADDTHSRVSEQK